MNVGAGTAKEGTGREDTGNLILGGTAQPSGIQMVLYPLLPLVQLADGQEV